MLTRRTHNTSQVLIVLGLSVFLAVQCSAQEPPDPQPHTIAIDAGFDVLNRYIFRGVRQNSTDLAMWPAIDLSLTTYSSDGAIKKVSFDFEFWNSLHTGDTGSAGPSGELWYESRLNGTVGVGFGRGLSVGTTYTAYTSPNGMFTSVKELSVRLDFDDRKALGRGAVRPYALVALELDTKPGMGQLDGGLHAGRYLELGIAPGYAARHASLSIPVKLGLSVSNYYELAGEDNAFGFFSVGGIVTVPTVTTSHFGTWNVHAGVDYQVFGEPTKVFNGGDDHKFIGLAGIRFSY
jgi:hypothetical protein